MVGYGSSDRIQRLEQQIDALEHRAKEREKEIESLQRQLGQPTAADEEAAARVGHFIVTFGGKDKFERSLRLYYAQAYGLDISLTEDPDKEEPEYLTEEGNRG